MAWHCIGWFWISSDGMVLHRVASDGMVLHRVASDGIGGMRWHRWHEMASEA